MAARVLPACAVLLRQSVVTTALFVVVLVSLISTRPVARAVAAGGISGRVTSSTNGLGLQGTVVKFYDIGNDDFVPGGAVTDANGDYTMNLAAGSYAVLTQDTHGHINEIYDNVKCSTTCDTSSITLIDVTTTVVTGIDFVLDPGGRVAGTITSSATGLPVANVRVDFVPTVGDQFPFTSAVTDGSGNYLSDAGMASGNVIAVTFNNLGLRDEVYDNIYCAGCDAGNLGTPIPVTAGMTTGGINFVLDPGGQITGTVTDASATPLANVPVLVAEAATGDEVAFALTDAMGHYATSGLVPGSYHVYTQNNHGLVDEIYNNITCPRGWCDRTPATSVVIAGTSVVSNINFALDAGGRISGTVTEAAGGMPVDTEVFILNSSGFFVTGTGTNSNGGYTTGALPPGVYFAVVNDPNYANQIYNGAPCANFCNTNNGTPINVVVNQTSTDINFSLVAPGSITGTVTNVVSGTPISNYQVQLFTSSGLNLGVTSTNGSGVYTFIGTTPGSYYVRTSQISNFVNQLYNGVTCVNCNVLTSGGTLVQAAANVTTTNINFALAPGGRISGTITNANGGAPIQNVQAQVFGAGGIGMGTTNTNASGVFNSFGLPAGTYFVRTGNTLGFVNELWDNIPCPGSNCSVQSGTPISVTVGVTTQNINFALNQGGTITGTVTSEATGFGISGIAMGIYSSAGTLMQSLNTNVSGVYTTSGLPVGNYHVRTTNNLGYLDELYDNIPCLGCNVTTGTPIAVTAGVTTPGINFALAQGGGSIAGTVTDAGSGLPVAGMSVRVFTSSGIFVKFQNTNASGQYTLAGLPAGTYYLRTQASNTQPYVDELYNGMPCHPTCNVTTGAPITVVNGMTQSGIDFSLARNLVSNGRFDFGTNNWTQFATPDLSYIVSQIVGGVFEYYRNPPPPGTSNQAVVFQNTNVAVPTQTALTARFSLGNSSSVRKRISVLVIDGDFSDLSVCTFWIPAGTPMTPYRMHTHTTKAWTNAAIYFYAATAGSNGGFYRLDDVALELAPGGATNETECVDPFVPVPPGGPPSADLLVNGNFNTGVLTPWQTFGTITHQIAGGVFEFIRNPGLPAGVVLQPTSQPMNANQIMTATFQLGNSSGVRKRVTVLLHDNDFSDLSACTFWLPPGQPLSNYAMQTYATEAWTNATLSVYGATVGPDQWIRLDNATFTRTPSSPISGTNCLEPGATPVMNLQQMQTASDALAAGASAAALGWDLPSQHFSTGRGETAMTPAAVIDLRSASGPTLAFRSWLSAGAETMAEVQVSTDGVNWMTVGAARPSEDWELIAIDLGEFAGQILHVRLVLTSHGAPNLQTAVWRIGELSVGR